MSKKNNQSDDAIELTPEQRQRFTQAARYAAGLSKFLLWCNSMPQYRVTNYANSRGTVASNQIVQLDKAISSRFALGIDVNDPDTVFFGAQTHEMAWLSIIPWSYIFFDGECLFFDVRQGSVIGLPSMPRLTLAVSVPYYQNRQWIDAATKLRFFEIYSAAAGSVTDWGGVLRENYDIIKTNDIVREIRARDLAKQAELTKMQALL